MERRGSSSATGWHSNDHRPVVVDRAAMIEAASRGLRQQAARARDRPRSKGSQTADGIASGSHGATASAAAWLAAASSPAPQGNVGHAVDADGPHNAQRRIRSAENEHRRVVAAGGGGSRADAARGSDGGDRGGPSYSPATLTYSHYFQSAVSVSPPASALDRYPTVLQEDDDHEEPGLGAAGPPLEEVAQPFPVEELKRPLSRKKDPSASAAAGLGALSNPARVTDAFEQRKTRQPIPIESWGPRPPSRHRLPPKANDAAALFVALDEETKIISSSSRSRASTGAAVGVSVSDGVGGAGLGPGVGVRRPGSQAGSQTSGDPAAPKVTGGTWAAARDGPPPSRGNAHQELRRGRERKASNRGADAAAQPGRDDLGVFGCGARSPEQQLLKSFSGALFEGPQVRDSDSGWVPQGADLPISPLEVNCPGLETSTGSGAGAVPVSPAGTTTSSCASPPTRKGRHSVAEAVSVEDVDCDNMDLSHHLTANAYRRDATPPQVIVTRSSETKKNRGDPRKSSFGPGRGRDQRAQRERGRDSMPFATSLDTDFLSLFAS